jgi:hypothetical protein
MEDSMETDLGTRDAGFILSLFLAARHDIPH